MKLNSLLPCLARSDNPTRLRNFPLEELQSEGYKIAPGLRRLIDLGLITSISICSKAHEDGRTYYIGTIATPFGKQYLQVAQAYNWRGKLKRRTVGLLDIVNSNS